MKNPKRKYKKFNIVGAFFKLIPRIVKVSPWMFFVSVFLNLIDGLTFGLVALVTQWFLERATDFANQNSTLLSVVTALIMFALFQTMKNMLNGVAHLTNMIYMRKTEGELAEQLHNKANRIPSICFEDKAFLEELNNAKIGITCANKFVNSVLLSIDVYIPYFIVMGVYLFNVSSVLVISLLLVFVPTIVAQLLRSRLYAVAEQEVSQIRRECDYFELCMVGKDYFKETRTLGVYEYFRELYVRSVKSLNRVILKIAIRTNIVESLTKILSLGGYIGILLFLFQLLKKSNVSVEAFAAIFASTEQMFSMMEDMICKQYGSVARDFGKVQNYLGFLELPERTGVSQQISGSSNIYLKGVSFAYPDMKQWAIHDVSLTVNEGETVAIVGENGSGKSTLTHLISGLYMPNKGKIFYGDVDISTISNETLFRNISAVFQKYQRYQMTWRDNIRISNISAYSDDRQIQEACCQAGIDNLGKGLLNGYDTMLSREYEGIELSGGEWQRVAIARGLFRQHQLIILDEPTASIDPIEEIRVYKQFMQISQNKTCIIVTHRIGAARFADRIIVMKQGRIVEQGKHDELVSIGGEYQRLFKAQEQWYIDGV